MTAMDWARGLLGWGLMGLAAAAQANPLPVVAVPAQKTDWADTLEYPATILADEAIVVAAPVSERVRRVAFVEGQAVEAGALLVELEHAEEDADLALAEARLAEAELALRRAKELARQSAVSKAALDEAEVQVAAARATVDSARAARAERLLHAPFAGRLGLREVSPGAFVQAGQIITTLHSVERLRVEFSVPQAHLPLAEKAEAITVRLPEQAGRSWPASTDAMAGGLDPATRSLRIRARLEPGVPLRPGMAATVRLQGPTRQALSLPEAVLLPRGGAQFVYRVRDNTAEWVEVRTGSRSEGQVEIREGLEEGDLVVLRGGDRLRPGAAVQLSQQSN